MKTIRAHAVGPNTQLLVIERREGAILGVSAEISQISDAPGLDGVVNLFPILGGIVEIWC
jgi:hypothetical protein